MNILIVVSNPRDWPLDIIEINGNPNADGQRGRCARRCFTAR